MSRQFRSDDTSVWSDKYGPGTAGAGTLSGTYGSSNMGAYAVGACTGTSGATSLVTPSGWGSATYYVFIHQTQGTGAGNYELNKITSISGTTSTLAYALQNTYSTGAQVSLMVPYSGITVSGTLTAPAWNGSYGGIVALLCNGTTTNNSTITATGKGFRGHAGTTSSGYSGESQLGAGSRTSSANGMAGGGADRSSGGNPYCGDGGSGGHGAAGLSDSHSGGDSGAAGAAGGVAGLTTLFFGGSGGSGAGYDVYVGGAGGYSGGVIFLITRNFVNSGAVYCNGGAGGDKSGDGGGGGGGGAGGSILLKSQTATLGTMTASGGIGGLTQYVYSSGGRAPTGAVGRIHLDYMISYSGSTTPDFDYRQDYSLRTSSSTGSIII